MSNFFFDCLYWNKRVMTKAGSITGTDYKNVVFAYDDSYIVDKIERRGVIHHDNRNK